MKICSIHPSTRLFPPLSLFGGWGDANRCAKPKTIKAKKKRTYIHIPVILESPDLQFSKPLTPIPTKFDVYTVCISQFRGPDFFSQNGLDNIRLGGYSYIIQNSVW